MNSLSLGAQILYYRLLSVVDDFGRFHGSPITIRAACFPACPDKFSEGKIKKWLAELTESEKNGLENHESLVEIYFSSGYPYLLIKDFRQQQRTPSKFPAPPNQSVRELLAEQNASKIPSECEQNDSTSRSRIRISKSEGATAPAADSKPSVLSFPDQGESAIRETVERMYALHPKKRNLALIPGALKKAVAMEADPSNKLAEIEKCHAAWCKTEDWKKNNGIYAAKLDEWLADQGYTQWPQGFGRDSPVPKQRSSEDLDEKALALNRRLAEEWRRDHPNVETAERHPAE